MELFNNFQSEELDGQQIRATPEISRRVSVYDTIKVMTGNANPHRTWKDLRTRYGEKLYET